MTTIWERTKANGGDERRYRQITVKGLVIY